MRVSREEIEYLKQKEARVGRAGLTKEEIQKLINYGTGQSQSVGDLFKDAAESVKETFSPKPKPQKLPEESSFRIYDSPQEKALYDQKYQEAKNKIPSPSGDEYKAIVENARKREAEMQAYEKEEADKNKQESALAYQRMVERDRQEREQEAKKQALQSLLSGKK